MTTQERLAEPFPADVVGWKPQTVKGNRAVACGQYIDARDVMDRLDAVVARRTGTTITPRYWTGR